MVKLWPGMLCFVLSVIDWFRRSLPTTELTKHDIPAATPEQCMGELWAGNGWAGREEIWPSLERGLSSQTQHY